MFPRHVNNGHESNGKHHRNGHARNGKAKGKIVATYDYRDAAGTLLYQSVRYEPKDFRQRKPNERGGWESNVSGVPAVLFQLPELIASDPKTPVLIVEGEKDCLALKGRFIATTNVAGAGKWRDEYSEFLKGRSVVIIPDNDPPGEKHALTVCQSLTGKASEIKVLRLPGLPPKGDVSDWIAASPENTPARLRELIDACPEWNPSEAQSAAFASVSNETIDDPHRLAEVTLSRLRRPEGDTLRFWRGSWWQHDGTVYHEIPDADTDARIVADAKSEFDRECKDKLAAGPSLSDNGPPRTRHVTTKLTSNVRQALKSKTLLPSLTTQETWLGDNPSPSRCIAATNGILDIDSYFAGRPSLLPHTPQWFSRIRLPYEFIETAECPTWLAFLNRNLAGDAATIAILQEFFGLTLIADTSFQKFLMLSGEGSNGKSVDCAALIAMLGTANVSTVPLECFGQRFALHSTLGKLANIAAEIGELDKAAEGILKSFTSGDSLTFERKHKDPVTALPTARLVLATNNLPRLADRSEGIWRRMILIEFNVVIGPDERIVGMDKPEWWQATGELPGILNWALAGLCRLLEFRQFTHSKACDAALETYKRENNPARVFLLRRYAPSDATTKDGGIQNAEAYRDYSEWCRSNNYQPLGSVAFGREIKRTFKHVPELRHAKAYDRLGNRGDGWKGICERKPQETEQEDE